MLCVRKHKSAVCVLGGSTRVLCVRKHKSVVCEEAQE